MRAPASAIGKKAKCPKCGNAVPIVAEPAQAAGPSLPQQRPAAASPRTAAAPSSAAIPEEDGGLLDDLARLEQTVQTTSSQPVGGPTITCPGCGVPVPAGNRLCIACGYDLKHGRRLQTVQLGPSAVGRVGEAAKVAGGFTLGVVLSFVGALIGAGVWCAVTVATNYEIGYIAWGLGILAGLGMLLGYRRAGPKAGAVAACIAVIGIIAAKIMIVAYFVGAEIKTNVSAAISDNPHVHRLAEHHTERAARRQGLSYSDPAREDLYDVEVKKFANLPSDKLDAETKRLDEWEAGGRYADGEYVRDALLYEYVDLAIAEAGHPEAEEESDEEFSPEEWAGFFSAASAKVNALPPEKRLQELKRLEAEEERRGKENRLAWHRATLEAQEQGLYRGDEKRETLRNRQLEKIKKLSEKDLDAAIEGMEAWEKGEKWADAEFVRNELIYEEADELWRTDSKNERQEAVFSVVPKEEWPRLYAQAKAKVDGLRNDDRITRAKALEVLRQARLKIRLDRLHEERQAEVRANLARAGGGLLKEIIRSMFNPFDLLFVGLAVVSAYKLASMGLIYLKRE